MMRQEAFDYEDSIPSYLGRLTQAPLLSADEEAALTLAAHPAALVAPESGQLVWMLDPAAGAQSK